MPVPSGPKLSLSRAQNARELGQDTRKIQTGRECVLNVTPSRKMQGRELGLRSAPAEMPVEGIDVLGFP